MSIDTQNNATFDRSQMKKNVLQTATFLMFGPKAQIGKKQIAGRHFYSPLIGIYTSTQLWVLNPRPHPSPLSYEETVQWHFHSQKLSGR